MKGRAFTTLSELCHREWLSDVLKIPRDPGPAGIDLVDGHIGVEMKCRYDRWSPIFTIHAYQRKHFRQQNPGVTLYWAFLLYGLSKFPEKIKDADLNLYISRRDCWFLPWSFVGQFPIWSPKTGPYIYVNKKAIPSDNAFIIRDVNGGRLYLPKDARILEERLSEAYQTVPF